MANMLKRLKYPAVVTFELFVSAVFALPRFRLLNWFKSLLLKVTGASVGRRVVFYPGVWIMTGRKLTVGDDVDFAKDVIVTTDGGVNIGDRVLIGYRTQILSRNHVVPSLRAPIFDAGHSDGPVEIANDVWIGANCVITPGVSIGEGAVVGAGSVVTKDIPPFCLAAGVPARVIRNRC